jgi:toxin secretion/phage lysis holin
MMGTSAPQQTGNDWLMPLLGGIAGAGVGLWAGVSPLLQALVVLMVVDVITGVLAGAISGQVSSAVGLRGALKKGLILALALTVSWLNAQTDLSLGVAIPAAPAVTGWFCLQELISILENAHRSGVNLGPLKAVLAIASASGGRATETEPEPTRGR